MERLRRLPGARWIARRGEWLVTGLLLAALVAFIVWGLQPTPLRVTLADLRAGGLPATSSWIIISGEMVAESASASGLVYRLTDGTAPNSWMLVHSDMTLTIGHTTVSGTYFGQRDLVPEGYAFIGQMQADPVLAAEQPPPWIALILAAIALLVVTAGRFSYPTFFAEAPGDAVTRPATVRVRVHRDSLTTSRMASAGTLRLEPGTSVELSMPDADAEPLRLYSRYTSVDAGELRGLTSSEPALRVRQPKGDLMLTFSSRRERDATFSALIADTERHIRPLEEGTSDS